MRHGSNPGRLHRVDRRSTRPRCEPTQDAAPRPDAEHGVAGGAPRLDRTLERRIWCSQAVHFASAFQVRALYERNGYELVSQVEDFPSGTDVLWCHKRRNPPNATEPGTDIDRLWARSL